MTRIDSSRPDGGHSGPGPNPAGAPVYDRVQEAAAFVRARLGGREPAVGLVLGSGLGGFADGIADAASLDYADIPHFAASAVVGHAGRLVVGARAGVTCAAMQGRAHYYEGHSMERVVFGVRTLIALGARTLIITNAAGGLRSEWEPGALMLIRDHINLLPDSPLRGIHDDRLGPRFPDMTAAYPIALRELARGAARSLGIRVEEGVYAGLPGPSYETPAEIQMLRAVGADAVGMSTVPEVIAAVHMGAHVLGISCITNKAAGITGEPLTHDEVTHTAARIRATFERLLDAILTRLVPARRNGGEGGPEAGA